MQASSTASVLTKEASFQREDSVGETEFEGSCFYEHCPFVSHWIRFQLGITSCDYVSSIESEDGEIHKVRTLCACLTNLS